MKAIFLILCLVPLCFGRDTASNLCATDYCSFCSTTDTAGNECDQSCNDKGLYSVNGDSVVKFGCTTLDCDDDGLYNYMIALFSASSMTNANFDIQSGGIVSTDGGCYFGSTYLNKLFQHSLACPTASDYMLVDTHFDGDTLDNTLFTNEGCSSSCDDGEVMDDFYPGFCLLGMSDDDSAWGLTAMSMGLVMALVAMVAQFDRLSI